MDHGVGNIRAHGVAPAGRADEFGDPRNAERIGEPQHVLDAMNALGDRDAAGEGGAKKRRAQTLGHRRNAPASGQHREIGRPVARLGRYGEVVAAKQPRSDGEALREIRPRRHHDDAVEIGIAGENALGAGEDERLDPRVGPGAPEAAHQRRREQDVAQPAQHDHEDARPRRKVEAVHDGDAGASAAGEREPRITRPPRTPTPIA